jgi:hypothetical protein
MFKDKEIDLEKKNKNWKKYLHKITIEVDY